MNQNSIYRDIAGRCGGDIYIGVVGPVRTGKSSFIKRFMELMVLPNMDDENERARAVDELPQSASGRTIMTNQPRFVPSEAIEIPLKDSASARVRLVDCVGYLIPGALGTSEGDEARMLQTPWSEQEIPFEQAAEIGTQKVISEHSTIGVVVTTDGSIGEIEREAYEDAEARVVSELKALGKPFVLILNSTHPEAAQTRQLREKLHGKYNVPVHNMDVQHMDEEDAARLMESLLFEFPLQELFISAPSWLTSLDGGHWLGKSILESIRSAAGDMRRMHDHARMKEVLSENENAEDVLLNAIALNRGRVDYRLNPKDGLFYKILGEASGREIEGEEHMFELMKQLVSASREYAKIAEAVESVQRTGYGVVLPTVEEMALDEPELIKQGAHYGVKLSASAPSMHLVRVDLKTDVRPIVGTEKQSQELAEHLVGEYRSDPAGVWNTEVFGKPLRELVRDEMGAKLVRLNDDARIKLGQSLGKIINEGNGGMICILL